MPTLPVTAFSLGRAASLAAVAVLAVGVDAARAQSGETAAIAAGELAVQCQGDGALTDHLASLRVELTRARALVGQRRTFLERVKAMDLNRLTAALTMTTSDARAARNLDTPNAAGDAVFQSNLRDIEAEVDLLMEAAMLASIGDRLNPARNVYIAHIRAAEDEAKTFENFYRNALKNCRDRNGAPMLARDDRDDADGARGQIGADPASGAASSRPAAPFGARPAVAATAPVTPARNPFDAEEAPLSGALQMTPMSEAETRAMADVASGGRRGAAPSARLDLESFSGRYSDGAHIFEVTGRENVITFMGSRPGAGLSINGLNCSPQGSAAICQGDGYSQDENRRIAFAGRLTAFRQGGTVTLNITLNAVTLASGQAQPADSAYLEGATLNFVMRPY